MGAKALNYLTQAGIAFLLLSTGAGADVGACSPKISDLVALETACLRLAELGDVSAQSNLGWLYDGLIPNRLADSTKWYRRAAQQGDARSQNNLGVKYFRGRGVLKDYGQALGWFEKSAKQGFAPAQKYICIMYADGLGVPKDSVKAYAWCNIATVTVTSDDPNPGEYELMRDFVEVDMSNEDVTRAQVISRKCLESHYTDCD